MDDTSTTTRPSRGDGHGDEAEQRTAGRPATQIQAENNQLREQLSAAREEIDQLHRAVESNRRIGAAIGILMFQHKITEEQSFQLLRLASQHTHRKLADVAEEVLDTGQLDLPHGLDRLVAGGGEQPE